MRNPVETYKRKFDGSSKPAWRGDLVEETPDGWFVVFYERPPWEVGGEAVEYALRYLSLVKPLSVLVSFNGRGETLEYQCDVAFPATIIGRRIDFIDLDVDLMVAPDGTARERDHDTFARNRETMGYSPEAVRMAAEGMALAHELHERGLAPFDGSPQGVLGRVVASMGPL